MFEEAVINKEGDFVINVGPQHPATHGVLHLVITLNGETIRKVEPHLGYIHRSIEKMCESLSYRQFIYVTSRMDYLSAHINNHACALCVEKGLQVEVPPRAQAIRVLMSELTRIASHELWWGAMAMDLGAFTPFFHAFRERETINDIMEETCGARLTMNYMVPGGVMADIHPNFQRRVRDFLKLFKDKIREYDELVTGNVIFQNRMKGVGSVSYTHLTLPTKAVLKLPKGEFYSRVETARGELGVYIVSEGGTTPYRIKFRSPGFSNLSILDHMTRGGKIGDLVAAMGTLDLVIPDIDR